METPDQKLWDKRAQPAMDLWAENPWLNETDNSEAITKIILFKAPNPEIYYLADSKERVHQKCTVYLELKCPYCEKNGILVSSKGVWDYISRLAKNTNCAHCGHEGVMWARRIDITKIREGDALKLPPRSDLPTLGEKSADLVSEDESELSSEEDQSYEAEGVDSHGADPLWRPEEYSEEDFEYESEDESGEESVVNGSEKNITGD